MRILYISQETPLTPRGGIGTYLRYMVPAMRAAGHEVFLFTWTDQDGLSLDDSPLETANIWLKRLSPSAARHACPGVEPSEALPSLLLPELLKCVSAWEIDVIEATDYLSPAISLFAYLKGRPEHRHRLCVTYHHGFIEDFFEQDHMRPPLHRQNELTGERQQIRVSDLVVAPSRAALANLRRYGIFTPAEVVREPYVFGPAPEVPALVPEITYLGRICLAKGMDKFVYLANAIHGSWPLRRITCVGHEVPTPFRVKDTRLYMKGRLAEELADKLAFHGHIPRSEALALLAPGQLAPHLGSADTFSYACVESFDRGLMPLVRHGTPMCEFFPEDLQHLVFPEGLGTPAEIQEHFTRILAAGPGAVHRLREHNAAELDPARIATRMGDLYARHLESKRAAQPRATCRPAADEVSILMPVFRPDTRICEAIDSIVAQSAGQPRVLICDDGSPQASTGWFDYAALRLRNVRIIRQPNGGLLAARNTLVRHLETPLAVFMDYDDMLDSRYLERVLETYRQQPRVNAVITERWNFEEGDERVTRHYLGDHLHLVRNDYRMTALIEAQVLNNLPFDTLRRNGEADDWDFWLRFHARGYQAAFVPEPLFRYRFIKGSMSWPWSDGQSCGTNSMLREAVNELLALRPELIPQVTRAMGLIRSFR